MAFPSSFPSSDPSVGQKRILTVGAKVGATSGWVVNAADNKNSLARCPASQSASTLIIPLNGLKVGDTITAVHLVGQIESAGGAVTLDVDLRKQLAAAADLVDSSIATMTQLAVAADTIISSVNSSIAGQAQVVAVDETYYLKLTATTAASTDIDLQSAAVVVTVA